MLRYQGILCVPNVNGLRDRIFEEAHGSRYSIHLGWTKIYRDLREIYWWEGLKRDIAKFVAKCPNFQQLKAEQLKSDGLLQDIQLPSLKWYDINIDFEIGLPQTQKSYNSI